MQAIMVRLFNLGIVTKSYTSSFFFMMTQLGCLLYTSDAADERSSVDLGGRRIIKKKNKVIVYGSHIIEKQMRIQDTMWYQH